MNRLCIYLTYDELNIVDRYIGFMLKELKSCSSYLVVVCCQTEIAVGRDMLEKYADEIFLRENKGFDAGGFKDALCSFLGWDRVLQYDELVLVNDSMFGPFRPMRDIFDEMDKKDIDFWGLTSHGDTGKGGIKKHIQTFFLAVRHEMLHCPQFQEYWENMLYYGTFEETVAEHEVKFTDYFAGLGYTFDTLADMEPNDSCYPEYNYMQYAFLSYELIRKRNFPFLKKQQMAYDTLYLQTQENLQQALDYIDRETDYDVDLIWENIIRTMYMSDLQRSLHLQYIIYPEKWEINECRTAVLVFISYIESAEYVLEYLEELKGEFSVYVFAEDWEYLEIYKAHAIACRKADFNDMAALLAEYSDYSLVCVLHDADMVSDRKLSCVGKSYFYNTWENLLKNREHVRGVENLFAREPRLGFLSPPIPNFETYFGKLGTGWNGRFEEAQGLIEEWKICCQISKYKEPFGITDSFWIRGCILEQLKGRKMKDNSILQYLWTFLAQDKGYYSGAVESTGYASMNEVNLQHYLEQTAWIVRRQYGDFNSFPEFKKRLNSAALAGFCRKYPRILVYGAGEEARKYRELIGKIEAYIVSDGRAKPEMADGTVVKYFSEVMPDDGCGIVVCLSEKNRMQVLPMLEQRGFRNYFCV